MTIVKEYLEFTEKWRREYGDKSLVLMQVGSFFESYGLLDNDNNIYGSNISKFSEICDMNISKKNVCVGKAKVVMAGFGLAQLEKYVKKLQDNGYTIVVYTQDSPAKNTTRSLNTIFSPGTYFSNDSKELSNNTTCVWLHHSKENKMFKEQITVGISNLDIYTGRTSIFEFSNSYSHNPTTYDDLERYISIYNPNECIIISNMEENIVNDIINFTSISANKIHKLCINKDTDLSKLAKNAEKQNYQREIIDRFYQNINSDTLFTNLQNYYIAIQSFVYLLDFIYKHNPNLVNNISEPLFENYTNRLILANHSLKQLNILSDNRFSGKYSSVSSLLNNCITSMGKRRFLYKLLNPITNIAQLRESYDITEHLLDRDWKLYRDTLNDIRDIEKLRRKLEIRKITPKDFTILYENLLIIKRLDDLCKKDKVLIEYFLGREIRDIDLMCNDLKKQLETTFDLEKAALIQEVSHDKLSNFDIKNILFVRAGVSDKLDEYYEKSIECEQKLETIRKYLSDLIAKHEKSTKTTDFVKIHETAKMDPILITTKRRATFLKKSFDEIKTKNSEMNVNLQYISKYSNKPIDFQLNINEVQTSTHGGNQSSISISSGFIIGVASSINSAKNKLISELELFYSKFIDRFKQNNMDSIINFIIEIDNLQNNCYMAKEYNYCKPTIVDKQDNDSKSFFEFKGLRHCLIEHLNQNEIYVTNDLQLGNVVNGILLYGTNAVGKTSLIKSIGISIIMAQAGLYVPSSEFNYYPYSKIFTRILGNDNIFKGLSTFAVEMSELRIILKDSDKNSLILGDELCSGTESDSALSIFVSGLEKLHENDSTFLFATHFHEIVKYDEIQSLDKLNMYHMSVVYDNASNQLVYDRKLKSGAGESMYGLEVCKSLNLPDDFLKRAHDLRMKYNKTQKNILECDTSKYNSKKIRNICEICKINLGTEIHHLDYQKNANKNDYINNGDQNFHKNHAANLINICELCHQDIHKNNKKLVIKKTSVGYELN